ncbi:MAG TPA: NADPH-dependent 7-cyano-7-deazaguanine reductase QueF [Rhodanobacteraceae bacterium]|jgi:7-cyano-7-deazaguanine reductase|nr:NADPH-dependent 7-cyano-7-deazaguanine reductase QueF [Rhodanobacteraceae bacterium]
MHTTDPKPDARAIPLGRETEYPASVDATVLFPVARAAARQPLGIVENALPFTGADIWNAWELSWLDARGKPCVAVAELRVPAGSPNIVESKSLKLYLGGYAMTRFDDAHAVRARIARDIGVCVDAEVAVELFEPDHFERLRVTNFAGESIDEAALAITRYDAPDPAQLRTRPHARIVEEALVTRLFRSRCPVTGQPDWASVQVRYRGLPIERDGLLRYLVSFREHPDFHEACVEHIFMDVQKHCAPLDLMVYARFLRRGGIDINPWRATPGFAAAPANLRDPRQ